MSLLQEVPECARVWDEEEDRLLLRLLADMSRRVSLKRTIVTTGVIAIVHAYFAEESGRHFSVGEVVRRINFLMHKYVNFSAFKALPGVLYNDMANTVTCGHDYLMAVDLTKETPNHCNYRLNGEPLYRELKSVFGQSDLPKANLAWVHAYFMGDESAMMEMGPFP